MAHLHSIFILVQVSCHFPLARNDFDCSPSSFNGGQKRSLSWWGSRQFLISAIVCAVFWVNLDYLPSHNRRSRVDRFTCTPSPIVVVVLGEGHIVVHVPFMFWFQFSVRPNGHSHPFVLQFSVTASCSSSNSWWGLHDCSMLVCVPIPCEDRMVVHSCSCSSSWWGPHGRSLLFVFSVRTAHGRSLLLVFVSRWGPRMVTHSHWGLCLGEDQTWSLTPVPIPDEGLTWPLTLVGVCVSGEGRTRSNNKWLSVH